MKSCAGNEYNSIINISMHRFMCLYPSKIPQCFMQRSITNWRERNKPHPPQRKLPCRECGCFLERFFGSIRLAYSAAVMRYVPALSVRLPFVSGVAVPFTSTVSPARSGTNSASQPNGISISYSACVSVSFQPET